MGLFTELGKPYDNVNRNGTSGDTVRPKVERYHTVADEAVVVVIILERGKERRASLDS